MHILMHNSVLEKKDNVVLLDRNITSAQIPIECTKCIGNSVQWISMLSFLLVNMQYVDVLWLRGFCVCCLTVYTIWLMTSSFTLTKHTVLSSLVWSTREKEIIFVKTDNKAVSNIYWTWKLYFLISSINTYVILSLYKNKKHFTSTSGPKCTSLRE